MVERSFSSSRADLLIQSVTDCAIYMLDPAGVVSSWNRGAERLKGYKPEEIIGEHFSRFYSEEDRLAGVPVQALQTALDSGRFEAEGWRIRKDGTRFWANVVVEPIRNERGEHVGFAKITRDLSEKHEAEKALRRSEERFRLDAPFARLGSGPPARLKDAPDVRFPSFRGTMEIVDHCQSMGCARRIRTALCCPALLRDF